MFQAIRRHRRFRFAVDALRSGAAIELSDTPVGGEVKRLFYQFNKATSFSYEASAAMLLLFFSILMVEEVRQRKARGDDFPMTVALPFTRIPEVIKAMIRLWEWKAPDRDRYETAIGASLKAEFNATWKRLVDQDERG